MAEDALLRRLQDQYPIPERGSVDVSEVDVDSMAAFYVSMVDLAEGVEYYHEVRRLARDIQRLCDARMRELHSGDQRAMPVELPPYRLPNA